MSGMSVKRRTKYFSDHVGVTPSFSATPPRFASALSSLTGRFPSIGRSKYSLSSGFHGPQKNGNWPERGAVAPCFVLVFVSNMSKSKGQLWPHSGLESALTDVRNTWSAISSLGTKSMQDLRVNPRKYESPLVDFNRNLTRNRYLSKSCANLADEKSTPSFRDRDVSLSRELPSFGSSALERSGSYHDSWAPMTRSGHPPKRYWGPTAKESCDRNGRQEVSIHNCFGQQRSRSASRDYGELLTRLRTSGASLARSSSSRGTDPCHICSNRSII